LTQRISTSAQNYYDIKNKHWSIQAKPTQFLYSQLFHHNLAHSLAHCLLHRLPIVRYCFRFAPLLHSCISYCFFICSVPSLSPPKPTELHDKLTRYLSTDPENIEDVLIWLHEWKAMYLHLSRMALDHLTIPDMQFIIHCLSIKLMVLFIFLSHIHRCQMCL
jgi:hypothetical protein